MISPFDSEAVRRQVREGYGKIATNGGSCCGPKTGCCGSATPAAEDLAQHIGYTAEELQALPEGANMGLSCGYPNTLAALQPGEVALDLGAGGGFDVFIAGKKVGATGRVIGVDMTAEMLAKARARPWQGKPKGCRPLIRRLPKLAVSDPACAAGWIWRVVQRQNPEHGVRARQRLLWTGLWVPLIS